MSERSAPSARPASQPAPNEGSTEGRSEVVGALRPPGKETDASGEGGPPLACIVTADGGIADLADWTLGADTVSSCVAGRLRLECRTTEALLMSPSLELPPSAAGVLLLRMKALPLQPALTHVRALAAVYHATRREPDLSEQRCVRFPVLLDGVMREYVVFVGCDAGEGGRLTRLRFDPLDMPGACEVESFLLRPIDAVHASEVHPISGLRACNETHLRLQVATGSENCLGYPEPIVVAARRDMPTGADGGARPRSARRGQHHALLPAVAERLVEEIMPRVRRIRLAGAEPLEAPAETLDLILSGSERTRCLVELSTNGVRLQGDMLERLYPALDTLVVALDAARAATHARLHASPAGFDTVLANLRAFAEARRSQRNAAGGRPRLLLSFALLRSNLHEAPDFVRLAADLGAQAVLFRHLVVDAGCDPLGQHPLAARREESLLGCRKLVEPTLVEVASLCRELKIGCLGPAAVHGSAPPAGAAGGPGTDRGGRSNPWSWCTEPWSSTLILPDGAVKPCAARDDIPVMGDLVASDFFCIWNGEPYRRWRRDVGSRWRPAACRACRMRSGAGSRRWGG